MTYADPAQRPGVILGLRELAALLESSPDIPVPYSPDVLVFPPDSPDEEICAEVDRVAALLGVSVQDNTTQRGHYSASRSFGPVEYRIVAIPSRIRAYHNARNSYAENVMPDAQKGAGR